MNYTRIACFLAILPISVAAQEALFRTDLPDIEGREELVLEVTLAPGHSSPPHRHNAHTLVYVLEGNVEMQVAGGELQKLGPGGTFYESPDDIHSVSRNPSDSEPAKILVVFIKMKGAPVTEYLDE